MKEVGPHSTRSANYNVNSGPTMGGGSPKKTSGSGPGPGGSDMGMHATNSIGKCPSPMPEYSPSATKQSKNR